MLYPGSSGRLAPPCGTSIAESFLVAARRLRVEHAQSLAFPRRVRGSLQSDVARVLVLSAVDPKPPSESGKAVRWNDSQAVTRCDVIKRVFEGGL